MRKGLMKGTSMTPTTLIMTMVIVSGIVLGSFTFMDEVFINYNVTEYSDFRNISQTSDIQSNVDDLQNSIQQAGESPQNALFYSIQGGWEAFKLFFNSFNVMQKMSGHALSEGGSSFPIPSWFTGIITVSIALILITSAFNFIGKVNV